MGHSTANDKSPDFNGAERESMLPSCADEGLFYLQYIRQTDDHVLVPYQGMPNDALVAT